MKRYKPRVRPVRYKVKIRRFVVSVIVLYLVGWLIFDVLDDRSFDPATPYLLIVWGSIASLVAGWPLDVVRLITVLWKIFRLCTSSISGVYLLGIRYQFHLWANLTRGSESQDYDEWKSLIVGCGYTVWRILSNYQGWRFWRWAIFDMRKVGQFTRFVEDWIREEIRQRRARGDQSP